MVGTKSWLFFPLYYYFRAYIGFLGKFAGENGPDPEAGAKPSMVRPMERPTLALPGVLGGLILAIFPTGR